MLLYFWVFGIVVSEQYWDSVVADSTLKFLTPFFLKKLGLVYEKENENKSAVDTYKKIKSDYPDSPQAQSIDGYIARVEAKL